MIIKKKKPRDRLIFLQPAPYRFAFISHQHASTTTGSRFIPRYSSLYYIIIIIRVLYYYTNTLTGLRRKAYVCACFFLLFHVHNLCTLFHLARILFYRQKNFKL